MSLNAAVKRFGPWAVLEYLVNPMLALLTTPLIIKNLGIVEFGFWVVMVAIMSFVVSLTSGASMVLAQYIAANAAARPTLTQIAQLDALLITTGASLFAALVAAILLYINGATRAQAGNFGWELLLVVMLTVIFDCVDTIFAAILRGGLRYAASASVESVARLTQFGLILIVMYIVPSISNLAAAVCIGSFIRLLLRYRRCDVSWLTIKMLVRHRLTPDSPIFNSVGWATVQNLGNALYTSLDRLIISAVFGPTILALYAVVSQLTNQIQAIIGAAYSVISNTAAQFGRNMDEHRLIRMCMKSTAVIVFGTVVLYGLFLAFASDIFSAWLGASTSLQLLPLVPAVVLASTVQTIVVPAHFFLLGRGNFKLVAKLGLAAGSLSVMLLWFASTRFAPEFALATRASFGIFLFSYFVVLANALHKPAILKP